MLMILRVAENRMKASVEAKRDEAQRAGTDDNGKIL